MLPRVSGTESAYGWAMLVELAELAAVQFNSTVAKAECGATFGATAAAISSDMATHGHV